MLAKKLTKRVFAFIVAGLCVLCVALVAVAPCAMATSAFEVDYGINDYTSINGKIRKTIDGVTYAGYPVPEGLEGGLEVVVNDDYCIAYYSEELEYPTALYYQILERNDALAETNLAMMEGKTNVSTYQFTMAQVFEYGGYTYYFDYQVDGKSYLLCNDAQGIDFMGFGHVVPADQVVIESQTFWEKTCEFFANLDYRPLWISLKTGFVSMIFIFILGLLIAWKTTKVGPKAKGIIDSVFTLPMVMPPTVVGFVLLLLFGSSTGLGRWFIDHGLRLVFSWPATVIAATVVALPLMYRTVRGAFESLDPNMLSCARTLGFSESRLFWRLMLPLAWPSIAAGTVLAFARAMGEFGATLFVAGNLPGITQTMPIAVYFAWMGGDLLTAGFWVVIIIIISFLVIMFINIYTSRVAKKR